MRLFARSRPQVIKRPSTPAGALIYAIGDIHGRLDLLEQLTDAIFADVANVACEAKPELVFVGDYIDRGPDSAGVIDHVLALQARSDLIVHTLKGNHEDAMLGFLEDPRTGPIWTEFGGSEALASYNIPTPELRTDMAAWESTRLAFKAAIPVRHVEFLRGLELFRVAGDYVFVHAGLKPGVPLERQTEQDMLWIRGEFLESNRPFEKVVVYGHTPRPDAMIEPGRIGIDTGAFASGVLTALKLRGEEQTLIQTAPSGQANAAPQVRTVSR